MNKLKPPGELFDVNGRKVHIQRSGKGSPTVLFDSGFFDNSLAFGNVQPQIANLTSTISYDRAGMGYSEKSLNPKRNSKVIVSELFELIMALGLQDPLVFVGWSAGGIYIREFARQHKERIAGMVLIDSASECCEGRYPDDISVILEKNWKDLIGLIYNLSNMTYEEVIKELEVLKPWANTHPDTHKYFMDLARPELFKYCLKLPIFLDEDTNQHNNVLKTIGDFPMAVIYRSKLNTPNLTKEQRAKALKPYHKLQSELARFSTSSWHIKTDCGHDIANERPDIVIKAIEDIVMQVRVRRQRKLD